MKFYPFWARAESRVRIGGGPEIPVACWRWSQNSLAEAKALADEALAKLVDRLSRGEGFPQPYLYQDRPLREPLLRELNDKQGELVAAITRNAYGCLVLNTNRVMFIDVDLPQKQPGFFARLLGKKPIPHEALSLEKAESWVKDHSGWALRVYRTRAGLRYLVTHALFDPLSNEAASIMEAFDADPLYRRLCRVQESFRARLTPKPWRVGMASLTVSYPYEGMEDLLESWLKEYDASCRGSATCAFIKEIGPTPTQAEITQVIALHDEITRSGSGLPLA